MKKHHIMKIIISTIFCVLVLNILHAQNLKFKHTVIASNICSQARQIGDFNNDGKGDILVIEGEFKPEQFAWYEFPEWKKHDINNKVLETMDYVADCSVADIDDDGDMDIILPDAHDNPPAGVARKMRVLWFENPLPGKKATEEWNMHVIADLGSISCLKDIEVADFNNDGKLDVAVRGEVDFYAFYQTTPLEWKSVSQSIKGHEGMASGDIDRDGFTDMIFNGYWLKNPGKGNTNTWAEYSFAPKWYNQNTGSWMDNNVQVRVADINMDGLLDIVISNSEKPGYPVSWYKAPKDPLNGTWIEQKIGQLDYCHTLQPGDFDNDGDIDVLAAEMKKEKSAGRVVLFLNEANPKTSGSEKEGNVTWKEQVVSSEGAYWAVTGDLGGDGDLDILSSRRFDTPPIEIWENNLPHKSK